MPSPFPGMDPWLESEEIFPDLHEKLTVYLGEALNAVMPPGYIAIGKQLVGVDDVQRRDPDLSLLGSDERPSNGTDTPALAGLLRVGVDTAPEPWEQPYLEIVTAKGRRLVTAIEVLSPANKTAWGRGRQAYLDKQEEFRLGGVNIVELDLLRAGTHTTAIPLDRLKRKVGGDFVYHVAVRVAGTPAQFFAAPIQLNDRLPTIGIPLDPGVAAVNVDLQKLLDRSYDAGRYAQLVRYDQPPEQPLSPAQAMWATNLLRENGFSQ